MSDKKIAEKATALLHVGNGVITRLQMWNRFFSDKNKVAYLVDKNFEKVITALAKKFPEASNEQIAGLDGLIVKAKANSEEFEGAYFSFLAAVEWKDACLPFLGEIATSVMTFKFDENPYCLTSFLGLVSLYTQLSFMLSNFTERKGILSIFSRLWYITKCAHEPNYQRVGAFVNDYGDGSTRKVQDDLKPISPKVGQALCSLFFNYLKMNDHHLLRKEGVINIYLTPQNMTLPSHEPILYELQQLHQINQWVIFCLLACPEEMALQEAIPMLKATLSSNYLTPLIRDEVVYPHDLIDRLLDKTNSKNLKVVYKNNKKMISDAQLTSATTAARSHGFRRTWIRQELKNLLSLFSDQPGLLGPKFQLAITALSLAKEEVLWSFRALANPPKVSKFDKQAFSDPAIGQLIWLAQQIIVLMKENKNVIKGYYLEYLSGPHAARARECSSELSSKVPACGPYLQAITQALSSISVDEFIRGKQYDFRGIRMNWFRAEVALSIGAIGGLVASLGRFHLIARHSAYIDCFDDIVNEQVSMAPIYFYGPIFSAAFMGGLGSSEQALYSLSYLRAVSTFTDNATDRTPEEREWIGTESVGLGRAMLEKLVGRIGELVTEISRSYIAFDNQLQTDNAAYPYLAQMKDNYKFAKDFVPPVPPAAESTYQQRGTQTIETLRLQENVAYSLCIALNEFRDVLVYDHQFTPREYLRDLISFNFKEFLKKVVLAGEGGEINRPSHMERQITIYASVIRGLENYVDVDLSEAIRQVWLGHVFHKSLSGQLLDWATEGELDYEEGLIKPVAKWYGDFTKRMYNMKEGTTIQFSPNRKGFISKPGTVFKAEKYADFLEFVSLFRVIGPYGFKLVDREILRFIHSNVVGLKEPLGANKAALEELSKTYLREGAAADSLKKFKPTDVETFIQRSIAIGNALALRKTLFEAARFVCEDRIPYVFSTVDAAFAEYPTNTFSSTDYMPIDSLAKDLGLDVSAADHALKSYIRKGTGSDGGMYANLLPIMFAACLVTSRTLGDAQYTPSIEAHSNNAHVLSLTIAELIACTKTSSSTDQKEITNSLMQFLEISSVLLLRLVRARQTGKPNPATSLFILIDKIVKEVKNNGERAKSNSYHGDLATDDFLSSILDDSADSPGEITSNTLILAQNRRISCTWAKENITITSYFNYIPTLDQLRGHLEDDFLRERKVSIKISCIKATASNIKDPPYFVLSSDELVHSYWNKYVLSTAPGQPQCSIYVVQSDAHHHILEPQAAIPEPQEYSVNSIFLNIMKFIVTAY